MNCHAVRRLRVCDVCARLLDRASIIKGYGADLCEECALHRAGGLDAFMKMYPTTEWKKLTLGVVGATGMRKLLAALTKSEAVA